MEALASDKLLEIHEQTPENHISCRDQAVTSSISAKNSLDTAARLDVYLRVTQVLVRARKACRLPRLQLGSILGEEARSIISDLKADMQNLRSGKAARGEQSFSERVHLCRGDVQDVTNPRALQ